MIQESRWLVGSSSNVLFWWDSWLGTPIADLLHIPTRFCEHFSQKISYYYFNGIWHFTPDFLINCSNIVQDILQITIGPDSIDTRVWCNSVYAACIRASQSLISESYNWGKQIWASYIPMRRSPLVWRVLIHGLVQGWFVQQLRRGFAFEAELIATMIAIEIAFA